jgi:hypothetical protein
MINLIQALIKARAEFPSIQKDKVNPHFKVSYASLDSVLDAVTPVLCKHGLAIVQLMEKGNILKTHLFHESGEFLTSEYELPEYQENQKKGAALTYARRYSVCALLSITADEDDDGNATKDEQKNNSKTKPSNNNNSPNNVIDSIRVVREFLGVDRQYVVDWLAKNNTMIADLKNPDQLMKDMCIAWAIAQGVDEFYALESYVENVKSPNLASIQKWKQSL